MNSTLLAVALTKGDWVVIGGGAVVVTIAVMLVCEGIRLWKETKGAYHTVIALCVLLLAIGGGCVVGSKLLEWFQPELQQLLQHMTPDAPAGK